MRTFLFRKKSHTVTKGWIVALIAAVFVLPVSLLAGDNYNFRGSTADAYFSSTDSSGCMFTDVYIFASAERLHDPPGPPTPSATASVSIYQYDSCSGVQLMAAYGGATLPKEDLRMATQLNSATLNTNIAVFDYVSGNTLNVSLDLNWTATGAPVNQKDHYHLRAPGFVQNVQYSGTFRPAQASGSVSDGVTNFTPNSALYGDLASVKSGSVTVN
jgi:hypothetical protein